MKKSFVNMEVGQCSRELVKTIYQETSTFQLIHQPKYGKTCFYAQNIYRKPMNEFNSVPIGTQ